MKYVYQVSIKEFTTLNGYDIQCTDAGISANLYSSERKALQEYKKMIENYKIWYSNKEAENLFPNRHTIMHDNNGGRCIISLYKVEVL